MTKYEEITSNVLALSDKESALKSKFEKYFVKKLSEYLECDKSYIDIDFISYNRFPRNSLLSLEFNIAIQIISDTLKTKCHVRGLKLYTIDNADAPYGETIMYQRKEYNMAEGLEPLFSIIVEQK